MLEKDLDNSIKKRIRIEDKQVPPYVTRSKVEAFNKLQATHANKNFVSRYVTAAAIFLLVFGTSFAYIKMHTYSSVHLGPKTYVKESIAVTQREKDELAAQGYIVEIQQVTSAGRISRIRSEPGMASMVRPKENPNTVKFLAEHSDIIIEGQVIGVKYFQHESRFGTFYTDGRPITHTESKVKVLNSYNAKVKPGDILTFVELGGVKTKYQYLLDNDLLDKFPLSKQDTEKAKQEHVMDNGLWGSGVMQPNDHLFIFGKESTEGYGLTEKPYEPDFLGKFMVSNDMVERFVPYGLDNVYSKMKMNVAGMQAELEKWAAN